MKRLLLRASVSPPSRRRCAGASRLRSSSGWPRSAAALCCAASLTLASAAPAQNGSSRNQPDAGSGDCTRSAEAHECAERCPSFDTCYVATGGGSLYYRVDDQRFECAGLECGAASQTLGDYCCARGDYAPDRGGGGGCGLRGSSPAPLLLGLIAAAVAASVVRRRSSER